MNPATVRLLLALAAAYLIWKAATASKRGTFLTIFGNIRPNQHVAFRACLVAGYALAIALLLAAIFPNLWAHLS